MFRGSRSREVQIAVPLRELPDVTGDRPETYEPMLDPNAFSWRVWVPGDCVTGPDQLTTFPDGEPITLPPDDDADPTRECR